MNTPDVNALALPMSMAERWSIPSSVEQSYLLADPLTGQKISPDCPPVWISDDQVLGGGLDYLRRNASQIGVTAFFVKHLTAEDLGDPKKGWYEQQVRTADFYGYESFGHTQEAGENGVQLVNEMVQAAVIENGLTDPEYFYRFAPALKMSTFLVRQKVAATVYGTPSFAMDVRADGTVPEKALKAAQPLVAEHPDRDLAGLAWLGVQNAREWIAIARLGVELKEQFGDPQNRVEGFITYGAAHGDMRRKASRLGVEVAAKRLRTLSPNLVELIETVDFPGMMKSGIILPLEVPQLAILVSGYREFFKT